MSTSLVIGLAIVFVIGAILFGIGTALVRGRAEDRVATAPTVTQAPGWAQTLGAEPNEPLDVATRVEMIERLSMVGESWSVALLKTAAREERDPAVKRAIAAALKQR